MNGLKFFHGVLAAFALAVVGSVLFATLAPLLGSAVALRALIAVLAFGYLLFLLKNAAERVGRITSVAFWGAAATALWWMSPPLGVYLLAHAGLLWLIRSLYFYSGLLPAVADLLLTGLSVAAGLWAASRSGSFGLSVWTFFLVQSLFVLVPRVVPQPKAEKPTQPPADDSFQRAQRSAEAALRRLSVSR